MTDKIELSKQELDDLKDDITFKTKVWMELKYIRTGLDTHVESSEPFRRKVDNLTVQLNIQWFLISGIILSILWFKFM